MRFLAFSSQAAYLLLGGVALAIFLFYLLRPRPRRVVVPSTLIWNRLLANRKPSSDRWRWLLSLLLALITGLALALAVTRPEVAAVGGISKRLVVVLDNSLSMATQMRDGRTRWEHAVGQARQLVEASGLASEVVVLDTMGYARLPGFLSRAQALKSLERLPVPASGTPRFPMLAALKSDVQQEVHFFTDGVAAIEVPNDARLHAAFEAVDNVAVTALDAQPLLRDPTRYEAFVQLYNASARAKRVSLELAGGKDFRVVREVELPAGQTVNQIIDVSAFGGGVLRASVNLASDRFAIDDHAYCVVAPHSAKRVLLVTREASFLQDSLRLLPGVKLTTITPAAYKADLAFDAYIFDRFAPPQPPRGGALLFRPGKAPWLPSGSVEAANPTITRWNQQHPLSQGIAWRDVQLQRAVLTKVDPSADSGQTSLVLARGSGEGALVTSADAESRWVQIGFALPDANLHLQSGFPVFLGSAIRWLTEAAAVSARSLGPIHVNLQNAQVSNVSGDKLNVIHSGRDTLFQASAPGVYTVRNSERELQVVVNLLDARSADVNSSLFMEQQGTLPSAALKPRWAWEPWMLLLLAAALLLIVEWVTYHRRVTL